MCSTIIEGRVERMNGEKVGQGASKNGELETCSPFYAASNLRNPSDSGQLRPTSDATEIHVIGPRRA